MEICCRCQSNNLEFEFNRPYSPSCLFSQFILRPMAASSTLEHLQILEDTPVDVDYEAGVGPGIEPLLPKLKTLTMGHEGQFVDEYGFDECYRVGLRMCHCTRCTSFRT